MVFTGFGIETSVSSGQLLRLNESINSEKTKKYVLIRVIRAKKRKNLCTFARK